MSKRKYFLRCKMCSLYPKYPKGKPLYCTSHYCSLLEEGKENDG